MATNILAPIKWFFEIGFGNVFVFILTTAIFYAVIRKSKILGESEVINGVIALIAGFLVGFWVPIYSGFSLVPSLSAFFAQSTVFLLFIIISFLLAGFFYPDLMGMLMSQFKSRHVLFIMMGLGIGLLVMSTLITSIWSVIPSAKPGAGGVAPSTDILIITAAIIIFVIILMVASSLGRGGI
jgi:DMSO/TMAO reductase YedYZ heme-binding membrane subunit